MNKGLFVIAALAAMQAQSHAQSSALGAASSYNVFTFGNFTESNVDSEGRVAVGGNANLTNFGVGSAFSSNPSSAGNSLVVAHNLTYNGGEVHYGNTVYGGTLSGSVNHPNGTVSQGTVVDFAAAKTSLTNSSTYWSTLSANGSTINYYGGIQLIGTNSALNVFNLSSSLLGSAWGLTIDVPAGSTVLVNIDGTSANFQNMGISFSDLNSDGSGSTDKLHVLYNFYQATSLSVSGISVQGSILAPNAALSFGNGNIEGNVVVDSATGNGEYHNYLFAGTLPVPEPSTAAIALGSLALVSLRRRR
jgi:choice-of-anchor A domain-containing protein